MRTSRDRWYIHPCIALIIGRIVRLGSGNGTVWSGVGPWVCRGDRGPGCPRLRKDGIGIGTRRVEGVRQVAQIGTRTTGSEQIRPDVRGPTVAIIGGERDGLVAREVLIARINAIQFIGSMIFRFRVPSAEASELIMTKDLCQ